jgi:hypothetical protein
VDGQQAGLAAFEFEGVAVESSEAFGAGVNEIEQVIIFTGNVVQIMSNPIKINEPYIT